MARVKLFDQSLKALVGITALLVFSYSHHQNQEFAQTIFHTYFKSSNENYVDIFNTLYLEQ